MNFLKQWFRKLVYKEDATSGTLITYLKERGATIGKGVIVYAPNKTVIDKQAYRSFVLTDYPIEVPNAWGVHFFMIGGTNVVMNLKPQQKGPAERKIDRAIVEMEAKISNTLKSSKKLEQQTQLQTMKELLKLLKSNNEQLFEVNTHIFCEEGSKKEVRALLRQNGYKYSEMFGRQVDAFISRNMSALDTTTKQSARDIPTNKSIYLSTKHF